jgi:hypothetical protein
VRFGHVLAKLNLRARPGDRCRLVDALRTEELGLDISRVVIELEEPRAWTLHRGVPRVGNDLGEVALLALDREDGLAPLGPEKGEHLFEMWSILGRSRRQGAWQGRRGLLSGEDDVGREL